MASPTKVPIELAEHYDWLRDKAHRERGSMAALVRDAIKEYREKHEPQLALPLPGERRV
jgi:protein-arginine kinase activator protein McsA